MSDKLFPTYGCYCDLDPDEPLSDCVLNEGYWGDCTYAVTSRTKTGKPRVRKTPNNCRYWIKAASYGKQHDPS